MNRKEFLQFGGMTIASLSIPALLTASGFESQSKQNLFFKISLAEWSFHKALFAGKMDHLDFPSTAKNKFDIDAVEYVNQFFKDKAKDKSYLDEMNSRCDDLGVDQVRIMIDNEGHMAVTNKQKRIKAVENHYKWVEAAQHLGCHDIRVNARGDGTPEEQKKAAIDSLGRLAEFAQDYDLSVIVENHGGLSSNGEWLAEIMRQVDMDNCGTLPDFGNFCLKYGENMECLDEYNRYKGVKEMMPFAQGVSAKSYAFNKLGEETTIDYQKMLQIVKDAEYTGYMGIEYEGDQLGEAEGVRATKKLLKKTGAALTKM